MGASLNEHDEALRRNHHDRMPTLDADAETGMSGVGSYSDLSTAVNTPFVMTPGGSQHDLHEDRAQRGGLHMHHGLRHSGVSSTYTIDEDVPVELHKKRPSDEAIIGEMALKRDVTRHGSLRHSNSSEKTSHAPDDAVVERTELVDLGKGMEPVIIVEWAPGDIEVCPPQNSLLHRI
jgi:hypothetical protein